MQEEDDEHENEDFPPNSEEVGFVAFVHHAQTHAGPDCSGQFSNASRNDNEKGIDDVVGSHVGRDAADLSEGATGEAGESGLLEGNAHQLALQAVGVVVGTAWCVVGTFVVLKLVDVMVGLRVTPDQEREGVDLALHGEALHP